ncbi:non-specific lipid-transfer protein 1-like [Impatiens glandulifera]|uniref:non-specific lipid-transfer protein 1-like n=1 Tax=Impatiens glandulifera TaxID=253017 RepID=UPI001FB091C9|nr:non-specific lipid-transfer protein 1-like [Impatiens glandulifera]
MAISMKIAYVFLIVTLVINSNALQTEASLGCGDVINALMPCYGYMRSYGNTAVPAACCNGIRGLNDAARTTPDRQTACTCLKQIASNAPSGSVALAASLPQKCGISIPYKIDPRTDCSRVR